MHSWKHLRLRFNGSHAICTLVCDRSKRVVASSVRCSSGFDRCSRELHTGRITSSKLWFNLDNLESMKRRELQQLCQKCGIKANSKTATLINDLREFHSQNVADASSIIHYPFILPNISSSHTPGKSSRKNFIPSGANPDRNLSLFSQMESPSHWISGEVEKLNKAVKSKGISSKTVGEYKGVTAGEIKQDDTTLNRDMYLAKNVSVSTVLDCTSSKLFMISRWQKQQIEKMGKVEFTKYKKELSNSGRQFHSCMNGILQGKIDKNGPFSAPISGLIKSVAKTNILSALTKDKVLATEEYASHASIGYSGTFDALAIYSGVPCVIEWKTSQKSRPSLETCYDAPLQVVAYAGAINSHPVMRIPVTNCLIVIAHHDGSQADVHWMDLETCEKFWQSWLLKVLEYKKSTEGASKQNNS